MGLNQGYIKLINGFAKTLNVSEKKRGWLFITKDQKALEMITPKVNVIFEGKEYSYPVDKYGRLLSGRSFVAGLPDTFNIKWDNGSLIISK